MDASLGLAEYAPYDKIILTAAPGKIPTEFKEQLSDEGILLAPVGENIQKLIKVKKNKNNFTETEKGDFIFVPLSKGIK
jgi:protein-L-isoaspartate(D-aspartate) O-methyltransferase